MWIQQIQSVHDDEHKKQQQKNNKDIKIESSKMC